MIAVIADGDPESPLFPYISERREYRPQHLEAADMMNTVPRKYEQYVQAIEGSNLILIEAPHRIESLARSLAEAAPARRVTLCRELTKQFETVVTLEAAALPAWLSGDAQSRHKPSHPPLCRALPCAV